MQTLDSAVRCEHSSVAVQTLDSAVRCEHSSVAVQTLDSAVRCEHSLVAVQTLTVPSDVNTPQSQPSAQHVVTNQAEVSKAAKV